VTECPYCGEYCTVAKAAEGDTDALEKIHNALSSDVSQENGDTK